VLDWDSRCWALSRTQVCVAQAQGTREVQADHYQVIERNGYVGVSLCDGVGSHAHGSRAAQLGAHYLTHEVDYLRGTDNAYLPEFCNELNDFLLKQAPFRQKDQFGTTGVALYIGEGAARWLSVGDSTILRYRSKQFSRFTNSESANVVVTDPNGLDVTRDVLTNWFGKPTNFSLRNYSFDLEPVKPSDVFVLFSDGFSGIADRHIDAYINSMIDESVEVITNGLMQLWRELHKGRSSIDNCTLAVLKVLSA